MSRVEKVVVVTDDVKLTYHVLRLLKELGETSVVRSPLTDEGRPYVNTRYPFVVTTEHEIVKFDAGDALVVIYPGKPPSMYGPVALADFEIGMRLALAGKGRDVKSLIVGIDPGRSNVGICLSADGVVFRRINLPPSDVTDFLRESIGSTSPGTITVKVGTGDARSTADVLKTVVALQREVHFVIELVEETNTTYVPRCHASTSTHRKEDTVVGDPDGAEDEIDDGDDLPVDITDEEDPFSTSNVGIVFEDASPKRTKPKANRGSRPPLPTKKKTPRVPYTKLSHADAAALISKTRGVRYTSGHTSLPVSRGEIRALQDESRRLSGGRFTISQSTAERVVSGDMTMSEALESYSGKRDSSKSAADDDFSG